MRIQQQPGVKYAIIILIQGEQCTMRGWTCTGFGKQSPNFKTSTEPKNDSKEPIPPGCVAYSGPVHHLNPIRLLALVDCLKIPAQITLPE
jgi:hypothetical protein